MGDPFSVITTALALAATAVQASKYFMKISSTVIDAKRDAINLGRDLSSFASTIEWLAEVIEHRYADLDPSGASRLETQMDLCNDLVEEITNACGNLNTESFGIRLRLKWLFRTDMVEYARSQLEQAKSTLVLMIEIVNLAHTIRLDPTTCGNRSERISHRYEKAKVCVFMAGAASEEHHYSRRVIQRSDAALRRRATDNDGNKPTRTGKTPSYITFPSAIKSETSLYSLSFHDVEPIQEDATDSDDPDSQLETLEQYSPLIVRGLLKEWTVVKDMSDLPDDINDPEMEDYVKKVTFSEKFESSNTPTFEAKTPTSPKGPANDDSNQLARLDSTTSNTSFTFRDKSNRPESLVQTINDDSASLYGPNFQTDRQYSTFAWTSNPQARQPVSGTSKPVAGQEKIEQIQIDSYQVKVRRYKSSVIYDTFYVESGESSSAVRLQISDSSQTLRESSKSQQAPKDAIIFEIGKFLVVGHRGPKCFSIPWNYAATWEGKPGLKILIEVCAKLMMEIYSHEHGVNSIDDYREFYIRVRNGEYSLSVSYFHDTREIKFSKKEWDQTISRNFPLIIQRGIKISLVSHVNLLMSQSEHCDHIMDSEPNKFLRRLLK